VQSTAVVELVRTAVQVAVSAAEVDQSRTVSRLWAAAGKSLYIGPSVHKYSTTLVGLWLSSVPSEHELQVADKWSLEEQLSLVVVADVVQWVVDTAAEAAAASPEGRLDLSWT